MREEDCVTAVSVNGQRTVIQVLLLAVWLLAAVPLSVAFFLYAVPGITLSADTGTVSGVIKPGETASDLLGPYLPVKTIQELERKSRPVFPFTRFREGQPFRLFFRDDELTGFEYDIDRDERLLIEAVSGVYEVRRLPVKYEIRQQVIFIDIKTNLSDAVKTAGEPKALAWQLNDIFGWHIDLGQNINPGDRFRVLVEKRFRHGKYDGYGNILAVVLNQNGVDHKAFYYMDSQGHAGYYNEKGKPLQKTLLISPVNYSRISSGFSNRRYHPVLKRYRPHSGIDYAAPKNTPVKAVAKGFIKRIGTGKTRGRYITIGHANGYETSYLHLNKFAGGMKKYKTVTQGEIIGYVGSTGLSTGYHLDFRIKQNGRFINPLTVDLIKGSPVPDKFMAEFKSMADRRSQKIRAAGHLAAYDR